MASRRRLMQNDHLPRQARDKRKEKLRNGPFFPAGTIPQGYQFETALQMHSWQDLAGIGAPVRVFLLTDLLQPDFPFGEVKLAVFLNAFMLYVEKQENALFLFFSQASFRLNQ